MLAPRMHERYFYAAVVFALPLAFEEPAMLGVFILLTVTCLFNLAYVLHTLQTDRLSRFARYASRWPRRC